MDLGERQQRKGRETMSLLCAKEKSSGVGLAVLQTWKHLQGLLGATGYPRPAAACSPPALHHTEPSALQVRAAHGACTSALCIFRTRAPLWAKPAQEQQHRAQDGAYSAPQHARTILLAGRSRRKGARSPPCTLGNAVRSGALTEQLKCSSCS